MKIGFIVQNNFLVNLGIIQCLKILDKEHEIVFVAHRDKEKRYSRKMTLYTTLGFPVQTIIYCVVLLQLSFMAVFTKNTLSLQKYCRDSNIKYIELDDVETNIKDVDVLICFTNRYLDGKIIYTPKYGAINIHPGLLPESKGAMPYIWSVIKNIPLGISTHMMTEKYDEGKLLLKRQLPLKKHSLISYTCCLFVLMPRIIRITLQRILKQEFLQIENTNNVCNGNTKFSDLRKFKKSGGKLVRLNDICFAPKLLQ